MSRYVIGCVACIFFAFLYPYFRMEIFDELKSRGIRTRDIRQKLKGTKNFWLYTEVNIVYGLGKYGQMTCAYLLACCITVGFHMLLGWWDILVFFDIGIITLQTILCSLLILFTRFRVNLRLFNSRFLLFGWHDRHNKKGVRLERNYYSTFFDIVFTVFPWIFTGLMIWYERKGL